MKGRRMSEKKNQENTSKVKFLTTYRDRSEGKTYEQGKTYEVPSAWASGLTYDGVAVLDEDTDSKSAGDKPASKTAAK